MSRAALKLLALALLTAAPGAGQGGGFDPHVDAGTIPAGCSACHRGHGLSDSPMLGAPQAETCLACHDSRARLDAQVRRGVVSPGAKPTLLGRVLDMPYRHPIDSQAFSEEESGVTCTSCHSPHRSMPGSRRDGRRGVQLSSPKNPNRFEFELCESCHAGRAAVDIRRLLSPHNASYHPVKAPAAGSSPSVEPHLDGREINCTDCHGNNDRGGPRGPHGSNEPHLLRYAYTRSNGAAESSAAYALCYSCHRRDLVLAPERSPFPLHESHVADLQTSCTTCHDAHGSRRNRALIRFGDDAFSSRVSPSASGVLRFVSSAPGSGQCYLTCHGRNHDPESYGLVVDGEMLPVSRD